MGDLGRFRIRLVDWLSLVVLVVWLAGWLGCTGWDGMGWGVWLVGWLVVHWGGFVLG